MQQKHVQQTWASGFFFFFFFFCTQSWKHVLYDWQRFHATHSEKPYKSKLVRRSQCPWRKILGATKKEGGGEKDEKAWRALSASQVCAVFSVNKCRIRHDSTVLPCSSLIRGHIFDNALLYTATGRKVEKKKKKNDFKYLIFFFTVRISHRPSYPAFAQGQIHAVL